MRVFLAASTPVAKRYAQRKVIGHSDRGLHCLWEFDTRDLRALPPEEKSPSVNGADRSASNSIIRELFHSYAEHESYMSEIQLRRIVDKMASGSSDQGTDGDEVMQKGGRLLASFPRKHWRLERRSAI